MYCITSAPMYCQGAVSLLRMTERHRPFLFISSSPSRRLARDYQTPVTYVLEQLCCNFVSLRRQGNAVVDILPIWEQQSAATGCSSMTP